MYSKAHLSLPTASSFFRSGYYLERQLKLIFSARGEGNEMGEFETENACLLLKK